MIYLAKVLVIFTNLGEKWMHVFSDMRWVKTLSRRKSNLADVKTHNSESALIRFLSRFRSQSAQANCYAKARSECTILMWSPYFSLRGYMKLEAIQSQEEETPQPVNKINMYQTTNVFVFVSIKGLRTVKTWHRSNNVINASARRHFFPSVVGAPNDATDTNRRATLSDHLSPKDIGNCVEILT